MLKIIVLSSTLLLYMSGCDPIYSQDPEDIFEGGFSPLILQKLANPLLTPSHEAAILAKKQQQSDRLRVAVIDNGIDYLHPALIGQTNFKIAGGRVIGAGKDIMGDDSWAHPNLIDPVFFSFGAAGINKQGQIIGPRENPLALYNQMNRIFIADLTAAIRADEVLKDSLFTKVSVSNFTLTATQIILSNPEESIHYEREYEVRKAAGTLYNWDARENDKLKKWAEEDTFEMQAKRILDYDWPMDFTTGLPLLSTNFDLYYSIGLLTSIEGADRFYALLKEVYETSTRQMGYEEAYKTYFDFCSNSIEKEDQSFHLKTELVKDFSLKLHRAWYHIISEFKTYDPLVSFAFALKQFMTLEEYQACYGDATLPDESKAALLRDRYEAVFGKAKQFHNYRLENDEKVTSYQRKVLQKSIARMDPLKERFFSYMEGRGWDKIYGDWGDLFPTYKDPAARAHRNHSILTRNPYIDSKSQASSHGTHVASIIMANDPRIDIEPVRILTESKRHSARSRKKLVDNFLLSFNQWLQNELVTTAIFHTFSEHFKEAENKEDIISFIIDLSNLVAEERFEHIALDLEFFEQLNKAIQHIGENKIKLANISLGLEFAIGNPPLEPENAENIESVQRGIVQFLRYEYFKHQIGAAIQTYAPGTLFFVASGNSSGWFDSRERSGIPADITSPFIMDVEEQVGKKAVNNSLDHIITVISLKEKVERLSGFTNLPISDIPVIMAVGDPVLGAIKLSDTSGSVREYKNLFQDELTDVFIDTSSEFGIQAMIDMGWISAETKDEDEDKSSRRKEIKKVMREIQLYYNASHYAMSDTLNNNFIIHSETAHEKYRGTSMASPNAAGVAARLVLDKMREMKLQDQDIYQHPNFTPRKIMEMLYDEASEYGGYSLLRHTKKISTHRKYQEVPKIPTGLNEEYSDIIWDLIKFGNDR